MLKMNLLEKSLKMLDLESLSEDATKACINDSIFMVWLADYHYPKICSIWESGEIYVITQS